MVHGRGGARLRLAVGIVGVFLLGTSNTPGGAGERRPVRSRSGRALSRSLRNIDERNRLSVLLVLESTADGRSAVGSGYSFADGAVLGRPLADG